MRIGVPSTGPLGDRFEIWTVREPNDPQTTIKWTMCIFDSNNRLVLMDVLSHTVGTDPDVKPNFEDITNLSNGVYRVNVYYGDYLVSGCDAAPADQLKYVFFIHKMGTGIVPLMMDSSWYPERNYIFTMYVLNGIPFYQSTSSRRVAIPANADVFVEITGSDNNAYVGIVNTSSDIYVKPNTTIPFRAVLKFKLDKPYAQFVANMYANLLGFGRGIVVNVVDDYTFELEIVKTEVGAYGIVVMIFIFALFALLAWFVVNIVSMVVEIATIASINVLVNRRIELENKFLNEYNQCTDDSCRKNVENKYLPLLQAYDAAIGGLIRTLQRTGRCDGFQVGGVCIPWWVVVIAVVFLVLLIAR
jgi:hypothetical protein